MARPLAPGADAGRPASDSSSVRICCAICGSLALLIRCDGRGGKVMRSSGARIVGDETSPSVAHVVCGTCNGVTPVRRELLPGRRMSDRLHSLLAHESAGQLARLVIPSPG